MRLFYLLFFLIPILSFSQFSEKKTYNIKKINSKPIIDGELNEFVWNDLSFADNFIQLEPNNGKNERNNLKTEVKIFYDNKNIYFGIMMFDNHPDSILRELSKRDDDNKNFDAFEIYIDPFNNTQVEYNFMITAAGVQIDKKLSKTGSDKNWNAIWYSAVKINKFGWSAEIAIPFSQIRFNDNNSKWALNMVRTIRRHREKYSWNYIDIEYENKALQSGILNGIKNIKNPLRLSFMPYASIYAESYLDEYSFPYNYGMDLKYGINESFTLDMTLIPDFGQVSSDAMVLNLTPFELKYDEKRQFFNEGIELFNKGGDMFYSRRLQNDLINATKVSGRSKNGLGIAGLNAISNKTDDETFKNYNVIILDQALKNSSSISFMNTNLTSLNSSISNVSGIFTQLYNKKNTHVLDANLKFSQNFENNKSGSSGKLSIKKNSGNYRYKLETFISDKNYNPNDIGFYSKSNEIINKLELGYEQLKENKNFISSKYYFFANQESLFENKNFVNLYLEAETKFVFKNYLFLLGKISGHPFHKNDYYEARTGDFNTIVKKSKYLRLSAYSSSDFRKKFALDLGGGIQTNPLYQGYEYSWRVSPRYRFNNKFSTKYVLSVKNKFNDIGYSNNLNGSPVIAIRNTNMITNVLSGSYIINNKMDFSFKLRYHIDQVKNLSYHSVNNDGYLDLNNFLLNLDENENYTTWTSDVSWNWWYSPGSQISIVWKNGRDFSDDNINYNWIDNANQTLNSSKQNSISFKIVYYLDYLYLRNDKN